MKRESTNLTIQCSVQLRVDFERCDDHHGDGSLPQAGAPIVDPHMVRSSTTRPVRTDSA